MGLDLWSFDHTQCIRVGSYHSVHELRAIVSIAVLRKVGKSEESDTITAWLREDLRTANLQSEIDYYRPENPKNWIDYEQMMPCCDSEWSQSPFAGLRAFVDHSDCDGGHSVGQVLDISEMFDFIEDVEMLPQYRRWVSSIANFFHACLKRRCPVIYG